MQINELFSINILEIQSNYDVKTLMFNNAFFWLTIYILPQPKGKAS